MVIVVMSSVLFSDPERLRKQKSNVPLKIATNSKRYAYPADLLRQEAKDAANTAQDYRSRLRDRRPINDRTPFDDDTRDHYQNRINVHQEKAEWADRLADYYAGLKFKCERGARYPWLPLPPELIEPD